MGSFRAPDLPEDRAPRQVIPGSRIIFNFGIFLIQETGIHQIHGSFKMWKVDPTTKNHGMSYAYHEGGDYEQTNELLLKTVMALINR